VALAPSGKSRCGAPSLVVCLAIAGCYSKAERVALDIPLSPAVGHVRSPEFQTSLPFLYDISVGVKATVTDEATCAAVAPDAAKQIARQRGCRALVPPLSKVDWVVRESGNAVAQGSSPAFPWEWPRNAGEIALYARTIGAFRAEQGHHYVVELQIQPSAPDLAQFQPRLQVRFLGK
jgi:hypothetical protein